MPQFKIFFGVAALLTLPQMLFGGTVLVRPAEIDDVLVNPGMGIETFQRYNGDALNSDVVWSEEGPLRVLQPPAQAPDFPLSSVAYCRWHWSVLEPEHGKVRWEIVDLALAEARRHGQRLALRFMPYDDKHQMPEWYQKSGARRANRPDSKDGKIWQPDFSDPLYYQYWSALIEEAGRRYDGSPDVDSVDISTVGYWGEGWSEYMPEFSVQKKLIDVYLKAFRHTPLLMNFDQPEALAYGTSKGAGWRFDCWGNMQRDWSEMRDSYPEQIARTGIQEAWRSGPVSMETCWVPEYWRRAHFDVNYIINEALRWHVSTVNLKSSAIPAVWKSQFDDFQKKMGYRFALRRVEWTDRVQAGQALGLTSWWVNEGVAPIYQPFVLAFRLRSGESSVVLRTSADLRKWLPGDAVFEDPLFVPRDLAAGNYEVSVAMLDPVTLQPAIRLGIQGRGADGWYALGQVQLVR